MVTYLASVDLGTCDLDRLRPVTGADDATRATWVRADSYNVLVDHLVAVHGGRVFPAHREMLTTALTRESA